MADTTKPRRLICTTCRRRYARCTCPQVGVLNPINELEPQSGVERFGVTINDQTSVTKSEITTFADQNPAFAYDVMSMPDETFKTSDTSDSDLQSFFARPIKIASYNWAIDQVLFETFNPWTLFFENPRVVNRISNYNLLRSKLKVKIILNGNGFHYGRAIASYIPLPQQDNMTVDRAFFIQDVVQASQRPHVYLDPTLSQGGELTLPYFWYKNYLSIPNSEWTNMGEMVIHGMQPLKHANGASDNVTISVFAWAEEISLSVPTSIAPGTLSPQSGMASGANDEYGTGPISKPASILAKAAGALSSIPVIGAYARATQIGAGAMAAIASVFGYSRPINVDPIHSYKPMFMGNMVNTNAEDTSTKLSTDIKQELTIDSRVAGLGNTDEMVISSIASRESFLTRFNWGTTSNTEELLFSMLVDPGVHTQLNSGLLSPEYHLPACAFAVMPFKYWRGSMDYRFQIVSSNYHKGRIKIVYEPFDFAAVTAEYNTNYTYVLDIAETKDFTVKIGWGQTEGFRKHSPLGADPSSVFRGDGVNVTYAPDDFIGNGILNVYVVNELTIPNSLVNNDIQVNVFVSACDDFEVAAPDMSELQTASYLPPPTATRAGATQAVVPEKPARKPRRQTLQPQGGIEEAGDKDSTPEPSTPMHEDVQLTMASTPTQSDNTLSVYFGESIQSFRAIIKRYCLHRQFPIDTNNGAIPPGPTTWISHQYYFPFHRGYDPNGFWTIGSSFYSLSQMTLMNYIVPAYSGFRGGVRWKSQVWGTALPTAFHKVQRLQTTQRQSEQVNPITYSNNLEFALELEVSATSGGEGLHAQSLINNPVLEYEIPSTTPYRFLPAKDNNWTDRSGAKYAKDTTPMSRWESFFNLTTGGAIVRSDFCAGAEDFTTFFFTGAPILYKYDAPSNVIP